MRPIMKSTSTSSKENCHKDSGTSLVCKIPIGKSTLSVFGAPDNCIVFNNAITQQEEILFSTPSALHEKRENYKSCFIDCKLHPDATILFISDNRQHCIYAVDMNRRQTLFTIGQPGKAGFTDGAHGLLKNPWGICPLKNGDLLIVDLGNQAIRLFSWKTNTLSTLCGKPRTSNLFTMKDGPSEIAIFAAPLNICVEPRCEAYAYVIDFNSVRSVDLKTGHVSTICGGQFAGGWTDAPGLESRFLQPTTLTVTYSGRLVVAERGNKILRVIDLETNIVETWTDPPPLIEPVYLHLDRIEATLVITDRQNHSVPAMSMHKSEYFMPEFTIWPKLKGIIRLLALTRSVTKLQNLTLEQIKEMVKEKAPGYRSNYAKQVIRRNIGESMFKAVGTTHIEFDKLMIASQHFTKDSIPNATSTTSVGTLARQTLRRILYSIKPLEFKESSVLATPPDAPKKLQETPKKPVAEQNSMNDLDAQQQRVHLVLQLLREQMSSGLDHQTAELVKKAIKELLQAPRLQVALRSLLPIQKNVPEVFVAIEHELEKQLNAPRQEQHTLNALHNLKKQLYKRSEYALHMRTLLLKAHQCPLQVATNRDIETTQQPLVQAQEEPTIHSELNKDNHPLRHHFFSGISQLQEEPRNPQTYSSSDANALQKYS